ncbi:PDZ and LIM domain 2 (mystique) S homeolog [Xenopus laevis]|uniref:LOC495459 protein n=2 Tax=Xenopus laevis TaxID=8355 RepID=Q5U4N5_XENLA|nr:PDZ and LIM domain 2 (mystique) S homeolog [Xenopus laevis]AAH85021.1 LOC495459 protein [Xenopus laevis]OCT86502.1 hypothetical protein XELAEV_18020187mg [Xenopus laevis]
MSWLHQDSEVYKMLQGNLENKTSPRQSNSFKLLQEALESNPDGVISMQNSKFSPTVQKQTSLSNSQSPVVQNRPTNSPSATLRVCEKCNLTISEVAVKISEGHYRHPGCYVCTDCGMNLRMRGHFWAGEQLVCEKHARAWNHKQMGSLRS